MWFNNEVKLSQTSAQKQNMIRKYSIKYKNAIFVLFYTVHFWFRGGGKVQSKKGRLSCLTGNFWYNNKVYKLLQALQENT